MNGRSNPGFRARDPRCAGFTIVELLAIIVIVGLLVALALPAVAGSKSRTRIAQCASNLKQLASAMQIYGSDYDNRLPSGGGFWLWDVPYLTGELILQRGATRDNFYCPGFPEQNYDPHWNFSVNTNTMTGYRVTGYAYTFPNAASLIATNVNTTLAPPVGVAPATRVLMADATISGYGQNNEANRTVNRYADIIGGSVIPHRTPHLVGLMPIGGNVAMLDGHVEWRPFQDMHVRTQGSSPVFWW
jgi:prepilin-type processing-associated H-X9-DG protein